MELAIIEAKRTNDLSRKSGLDLIRFVAGTTKVMEELLTSISLSEEPAEEVGLSLMEWHVLDRLARQEDEAKEKDQPEYLLQSALVSAAETPKSSALSTLLSKLEFDKEWIRRASAPPARFRRSAGKEDNRNRTIRLTTLGRSVWRQAKPKIETILSEGLQEFSPEAIHKLAKAMEKIRNGLIAHKIKASTFVPSLKKEGAAQVLK
jgi:DNA-binding MarR family transcriptional regulator